MMLLLDLCPPKSLLSMHYEPWIEILSIAIRSRWITTDKLVRCCNYRKEVTICSNGFFDLVHAINMPRYGTFTFPTYRLRRTYVLLQFRLEHDISFKNDLNEQRSF